MATLYIFAGLPGTGKTSLAQRLTQRINAVYLRIDTIEQGLRDLCGVRVEGEGYRLTYRIAADNLRLGLDVVADSCNPLELTRREWEQVAEDCGSPFVNIEVKCSDLGEHRRRVEWRRSDIPDLQLPSWRDVESREYHRWSSERTVVETSGRSADDSFESLMKALTDVGKQR